MFSLADYAAVTVRPTFPFIKWVREVSRDSEFWDEVNDIIKEKSTRDGHIYLVEPMDSDEDLSRLISRHCAQWIENELIEWQVDPELWPGERPAELFNQWFTVAYSDMVFAISEVK